MVRKRSRAQVQPFISFSRDVHQALQNRVPVIALESAALSRGFDRETALELLESLEIIIRHHAAVPALIFTHNSRIIIGADEHDLYEIAGNRELLRVSRATLPAAINHEGYGVTTVSATMQICVLAKLRYLAVGGIGGVHRGAFYSIGNSAPSLDVSPDIAELARSPVAVFCSGPKSILDVPATLEMLESLGVPVVTIGSSEFPGYFSVDSGLASPVVVDTAEEAAKYARAHFLLSSGTGLLFAVPAPASAAVPRDVLEPLIDRVAEDILQSGIQGGVITARMLDELQKATQGRTEVAMKAISLNNAAMAAQVASAESGLRTE